MQWHLRLSNPQKNFSGRKTLHGGIKFKLKGMKDPITISCEPKARQYIGQVTFHVNFTQFGPIAFDLIQEEGYLTTDERQGGSTRTSRTASDSSGN